ncbi:glycosyltransferase family 2 protein [Clostridiaceae bacterium]|nr:glycosyltransferase family 2 protein [Clostridiaceae bacterium]RKI11511.1 glycosyltransferase family 2 protein [bacterium 1XD21-70]
MKQLLSIIVPIYNAEQYLVQCIESIINQTYDNLQIIFVDDGSTDSSLEICNFYAQKDKRIVIVQKENGGVVSARKAGVKAANGKMIGFVDADDWIEPDYFENMMAIFMETNADIVAGGHFHDIGESSVKVLNHVSVGLHETRAILDQLIYSGEFYEYGITPQLYTKIIRSDILKATQESVDERIQCGEDAAVTYPSVLKAKRLYVTDFCGYHYVQHQGSMTKTENREESVLIQVLIKFLEESIGNLVSDIVLRDGLREQLRIYNNYMLSLREIGIFDKKLLLPFGGISYGSKVVIYGAGVLGQKIYQYLLKSEQIEIVEWVDQNFSYYREKGLDVNEPGRISSLTYDYILIANISHGVFVKIKKYLTEELEVEDKKIRWFSDDFVN